LTERVELTAFTVSDLDATVVDNGKVAMLSNGDRRNGKTLQMLQGAGSRDIFPTTAK